MGHEFEVLDHLFLFLGWILLEQFQLLLEDLKMVAELLPVHIRLSLDLVLENMQRHRAFKGAKEKELAAAKKAKAVEMGSHGPGKKGAGKFTREGLSEEDIRSYSRYDDLLTITL